MRTIWYKQVINYISGDISGGFDLNSLQLKNVGDCFIVILLFFVLCAKLMSYRIVLISML